MEEANLHGFVANCLGICHCMVSVTLSGISETVNGASSQRWRCLPRTDGKTPRDCSLKKKKIKSCPVLYSLGSDWNEYQETKQNGLHCTCQESVPIGMKGAPIACYLQCHPHQ